MWPLLLRPEARILRSVSRGSAPPLCRSARTTFTSARRPADVGLTLTSATLLHLFREVDLLPRLQADIGLAQVAALARRAAEPLFLAAPVQDLHRVDLDLEQRLD